MNNNLAMQRLMDAIETIAFDGDGDDDFADCAFALLALAIGRLPRQKRDDVLQAIEVGGALSQAVAKFHPPYERKPRHPDGRKRLQ